MKRFKLNFLFITLILIMMGCFRHSQPIVNKKDLDTIHAKTIAMLPIENKNIESKASKLLRFKLFEEIYFKGYSKIPLETIDAKLKSMLGESEKDKRFFIHPEVLKDAVGADAGMYCSMTENYKNRLFYSPVKITVTCELRSTDSGNVIWNAQSESIRRNFDLTDKRLQKKLSENLELLIDEIVDDIIKTLPDGPSLNG